jgi:hypothetical protein
MVGTNTKPHARVVIAHSRHMDTSSVSDIIKNLYNTMMLPTPKIKWQRLPGLKLQAYVDDVRPENRPGRGLSEPDMDPIQAWSEECRCGVRMSFNVWQFKNEKQITMFLIRWSS